MAQDTDLKFVEHVVRGIVNNVDDIVIEKSSDESGRALITIQVHRDDMGKLIGKGGQTAKAIRSLVRLVGMKNGVTTSIKIIDPLNS